MEITFILPTVNRKNYVNRAIKSCLDINSESKNIVSKVLVLDGYSDDGAWELMQKEFGNNENVLLKQVDRKIGFQETAFMGLKYITTEYCTFMYNDDVLSKYYWKCCDKIRESKQSFIMGYGKNFHVKEIYQFKEPNFIKIPSEQIILNYFGIFENLKYSSLPVSPIASISKTNNLYDWEKEVRKFVAKSSFRYELMIKKNIGPDLILYLYNLYIENEYVFFCNSTISQLSFHEDSMSILYGKSPLSTGYWLSRIWLFEKMISSKKYNKELLAKFSAYILTSGIYIVFLNIFTLRFGYALSMILEILKILYMTTKKKFNKNFFKYLNYYKEQI